jgi:hypothetical protein
MPEIKHTFLEGKMNKSLDDRLVPEGEYRDAFNIEVTTDIDGSGDIGTLRKIKGNTALNTADTYFTGTAETIGSFFDDKNNNIYYFVTDGSKHKIYRYNTSTQQNDTIAQGTYLNFSKNYLITGINIIDNFLFWTDDLNAPRRINLSKIATSASYYHDLTDETKVSVAKYSPYKAPTLSLAAGDTTNNYIQEKFVRFSYRYKYDDGTYSQIAPFSPIAFKQADNILSLEKIEKAYKQGLIDSFVNEINEVTITAPLPAQPVNEYGIISVEFLMKDANSPAVRVIKKLDVTDNNATGIIHTYKSEIPVSTLAEKELLRVSENVPIKAKSQEIVGNRIVYGNYVENYNLPTLDYTLSVSNKSTNISASNKFLDHSIKQRRTYEVGIVLSDKYGRKSPVILGQNPTIYVPAKPSNFDANDSVNPWKGDSLKLQFTTLPSGDWHSYRVVVKQVEQEYYNVYIPGIGNYKDNSYITLIGDNVNKVPRDTTSVDTTTDIAPSKTRLYTKVINKSQYTRGPQPFEINEGKILGALYTITNNSTQNADSANIGGYTSFYIQRFEGSDLVSSYLDLNRDTAVADAGGSYGSNAPTDVYVFVNGEFINSSNYNYSQSASQWGRITWTSNTPISTDKIDIIAAWDVITVPIQLNPTFAVPSLTNMFHRVGGTTTVEKTRFSGEYTLELSAIVDDPYANNFTFSQNYASLSDDPLISVSGIGTISSFSSIDVDILPKNNIAGFYNLENNNYIAQLPEDSDYLEIYNFSTSGISGMGVDLAVLETEPFKSSIDIYYETPTSGLLSELQQNPIPQIEIDYYNTFIIKGYDPAPLTRPVWHIEESRIKGEFNGDSVDFGVVAHATNSDYEQTRRENTLIYSGIYNPRTGFNETNQFPSSENITKSLDLQYGSIQKLFAEERSLIVFQEEKISNIPIDRDIIYTAEGMPQVATSNRVFGDPMVYAGNYGIGKNPESFAHFAGRKYFVDKPKGAVIRLSRDGITEISNYGMRTYFVNQLNMPTNITVYNDNIFGMWDMAKRQYVLHAGKNYISNVEATVFPAATFQEGTGTYRYYWTLAIFADDANGTNQSLSETGKTHYIIYTNYSNISSQDAYNVTLPVDDSGYTWQTFSQGDIFPSNGGQEEITVTKYNNIIYAEDADGNNQSLTRGDRNFYYVNVTSAAMEESDLPIGTGTWATIVDAAVAVDESVTLSYDESAQGWVSFYDFNPQTGGSIDGKFYTFKDSQIYEHHKGIGFYGATDLTASVDLVVNQNPSANKNFLGINYEGTNSWNIYNIETDFDTAKTIFATDNTKQDNDNEIFLSNFKSFDGKYFANLINNSTEKSDEILFGSSMSGVKGFFLKFKLSSTDQNAELFSVSTNYNINTY